MKLVVTRRFDVIALLSTRAASCRRRLSTDRVNKRRVAVVALGGNALQKRGEPMTDEVQRQNARVAAQGSSYAKQSSPDPDNSSFHLRI
jgi:hypothetical protein